MTSEFTGRKNQQNPYSTAFGVTLTLHQIQYL